MRFSDVIGHEDVKARLRQMVDEDRVPHSLVIQGPEGTGKMMLARALVQYMHCTDRHDGEPCGKCPSCLQHQSFNHIDTIYTFPIIKSRDNPTSDDFLPQWREFLDDNPYMDITEWQRALGKADANPSFFVSQSAELIHKLSFTTHNSPYKVAIVWLPERMNLATANKLLKLIEEPHADTRLIFVSDNPEEILPTIYSRLQRVNAKRLPDELVASYLMERGGVDADAAADLARLSEGSVNAAIKQMSLTKESAESLEYFKQLMRGSYSRDVKALWAWADSLQALKRERVGRFLTYCSRLVRENFIYNLRQPQLSYLNRQEAEFSSRFAPFINERNVVGIVNELDQAATDIAGNVTPRFVLMDLAIRMIILIKA